MSIVDRHRPVDRQDVSAESHRLTGPRGIVSNLWADLSPVSFRLDVSAWTFPTGDESADERLWRRGLV
jgi:hypothetical protein